MHARANGLSRAYRAGGAMAPGAQADGGGHRRPRARPHGVLYADAGRAAAAQRQGPAGTARQAHLPRSELRELPHAQVRDGRSARLPRVVEADDLSLHRSAAARHGRRTGGQPSGLRSLGTRMAHAAAMGPGADPDRERPQHAAARRPRTQSHGSGAVARRRSGKCQAARARTRQSGSRSADPFPGVAMSLSRMRGLLVAALLTVPCSAYAAAPALFLSPSHWMRHLAEDTLAPGYRALRSDTDALAESLAKLCMQPGAAAREAAQTQ